MSSRTVLFLSTSRLRLVPFKIHSSSNFFLSPALIKHANKKPQHGIKSDAWCLLYHFRVGSAFPSVAEVVADGTLQTRSSLA